MNKRLFPLLLCLFALSSKNAFSQTGFFKAYGKVPQDYAYSVQKTLDGGFIFTGISNGYGASNCLFLVKTDANGDTLWMKGYLTNAAEFGSSVYACRDSGFVVCGSSGFSRTDKKGNLLWSYLYTSVVFYSVRQTTDGGFILAGSIGNSGSSNGQEVYLLKTDSIGTKQWSRKLGGPQDEYATCIRQTNDGGYIFAGSTDSYGAGGWDTYVVKTNSLGDTLWTKTYGGTLADGGTTSARQTVEQTFDGGYIIGGYSASFFSAGATDAYLIKTDASGNAQWSKLYGGSAGEVINEVKQTSDSGYVFTGYTMSFGAGGTDIYFVKTNSLGDTLFTRTFGGGLTDAGESVIETTDKGFLICGYTTNYGSGNNDAVLIKIDSLGNAPCHQNNTNTVVNSAATVVGNTTTGKIFITLNASSPTFVMKSGGNAIDACIFNSIEENNNSAGIKIFPNPNNGSFNCEFLQSDVGQFTICVNTLLGETVYSKKLSDSEKINLEHLPAGSYLLRVSANDKVYTQQFFIAK